MLSVQQLRNALKKLQSSDLAKYLIQRATAVVDGNTGGGNENTQLTVSTTMTSSNLTSDQQAKLNRVVAATIKNETVSLFSNIERSGSALSQEQYQINRNKFDNLQNHNFHTQKNCSSAKTNIAMSAAAAATQVVPLQLKEDSGCDAVTKSTTVAADAPAAGTSCSNGNDDETTPTTRSLSKQPCFKTGLSEILQFLELVGNLKHTKRTGWVLRDVNDCESISGHMYRMSMMTFLLDGTEGLNQIRCMELALVHDLAESLVGDITPFCGVSKEDKRAMEFKAMNDICKLIEPRGNRIMELFEEYECAESAESKFVKDLDRLDMVMQAFEYEKRDNCLLKHQEFFDSTEGKFNHPFVKKLVNEIYDQRKALAEAKGVVAATNGQPPLEQKEKTTSSS